MICCFLNSSGHMSSHIIVKPAKSNTEWGYSSSTICCFFHRPQSFVFPSICNTSGHLYNTFIQYGGATVGTIPPFPGYAFKSIAFIPECQLLARIESWSVTLFLPHTNIDYHYAVARKWYVFYVNISARLRSIHTIRWFESDWNIQKCKLMFESSQILKWRHLRASSPNASAVNGNMNFVH